MDNFGSNAYVSYKSDSQSFQVDNDGTTGNINNYFVGDPYSYWQEYHHYHHYNYPLYIDNKSKIEQAFKIMQKIMERKIVGEIKLQQFIELVNDIATII